MERNSEPALGFVARIDFDPALGSERRIHLPALLPRPLPDRFSMQKEPLMSANRR
jgi:hypothetical protein